MLGLPFNARLEAIAARIIAAVTAAKGAYRFPIAQARGLRHVAGNFGACWMMSPLTTYRLISDLGDRCKANPDPT
jgi:hypothetical protein